MILARYITKQILLPFVLILLVLMLIMISITLTKFLNDPIIAIAGVKYLLLLILYKIPGLLYEVMPIAFFLAAFMGIGRMYMDIEMHVLFSCGISKAKLFVYALIPTFIIMLAGSFSENIARPFVVDQNMFLRNSMNDISLFDYVVEQKFTAIGKTGEVMYVNKIDRQTDQFFDVYIAKLGEKIIRAESATIEKVETGTDNDSTSHYLNITNGILYTNVPGQDEYSETRFERYRLALKEVKRKTRDNRLRHSTIELMSRTDLPSKEIWVSRLSFPLIFLAFLPWAMFLAQTPARKNYYWKILPLVFIYSLHGSGGSYITSQLGGTLPFWLGKWYIDIIFIASGLAVLFIPDYLKSKSKKLSEKQGLT